MGGSGRQGLRAAAIVLVSIGVVALTYLGARAIGWHPQFGTYSESLSAAFTALAVFAALYIASRDRNERHQERLAADLAQARLVMIEVSRYGNSPGFRVQVNNYGDRPVIGVTVDSASWSARDDIEGRFDGLEAIEVLKPDRESLSGGSLSVDFYDSEGNQIPENLGYNEYGDIRFGELPPGGPIVAIHFTDANGNGWTTGPFMGVEMDSPLVRQRRRRRSA